MAPAQHPLADVCIVRAPESELDLHVVPRLQSLLDAAARPGSTVVLDLQDVTFVDSSALAVVVSTERRLRASGGVLVLAQVHPRVVRVVRLCGLTDLLPPDLRSPGRRAAAEAQLCRRRPGGAEEPR